MLTRTLAAAALSISLALTAAAQGDPPPVAPEPADEPQPDAETQKKIDGLIEKLGSEDWDERSEAEKGLEEIGKPAIASLRKAMENAADPEVKVRSKRVLQKLGGVETPTDLDDAQYEELVDILRARDGADWYERNSKPSFFLSELYSREEFKGVLKDPKFATRLVKTLEEDTGNLRRNVCYLLADMGNAEVAPQVIKLIEDAEPKTRAMALYCCGRLGNSAVTPQVVKALVDEDKLVRVAAAVALENLPATEAIEPLLVSMNDDDARIRFHAYFSLRSLTGQNFRFNAWDAAPKRTEAVRAYEDWWTKNKNGFKPLPPKKKKKEVEEVKPAVRIR